MQRQDRGQKHLRHQHPLLIQYMHRAPGPQASPGVVQASRPERSKVERMTYIKPNELDRAPLKAAMSEQQRAERTAAEPGQPAPESAVACGRQHGVGKNDRHAITFEQHFADMGQMPPSKQLLCLIRERLPQAVAQQAHGELPAGLLATRGQRSWLEQPGAELRIKLRTRQLSALFAALHYWGRGAFSMPFSLLPGLMPRWANQPRFISKA